MDTMTGPAGGQEPAGGRPLEGRRALVTGAASGIGATGTTFTLDGGWTAR